MLFPFQDFWWLYGAFLVLIIAVLLIDLGIFNKTPHPPTFKEAASWTCVWVGLAALFNLGLYQYALVAHSEEVAGKVALEFLAGYVVEKTLAVDNIFVFALIFSFFKVAPKFQHKILYWGILGAVFFRAIFIALGSVLMQYHLVVVFFGVLLMLTGLKMVFQKEEGDLNDKWILKLLKKYLPIGTDDERGSFLTRVGGKIFVTPLFLALIVIELSDIVFAVDSVPAIFALTKEPFIVFTSNILAILGLRSMYFMISGFMEKFEYIKYGLAAVLIFVGLKMSVLTKLYDGKFPIGWSLAIIAVCIGTSIVLSLFKSRKRPGFESLG